MGPCRGGNRGASATQSQAGLRAAPFLCTGCHSWRLSRTWSCSVANLHQLPSVSFLLEGRAGSLGVWSWHLGLGPLGPLSEAPCTPPPLPAANQLPPAHALSDHFLPRASRQDSSLPHMAAEPREPCTLSPSTFTTVPSSPRCPSGRHKARTPRPGTLGCVSPETKGDTVAPRGLTTHPGPKQEGPAWRATRHCPRSSHCMGGCALCSWGESRGDSELAGPPRALCAMPPPSPVVEPARWGKPLTPAAQSSAAPWGPSQLYARGGWKKMWLSNNK